MIKLNQDGIKIEQATISLNYNGDDLIVRWSKEDGTTVTDDDCNDWFHEIESDEKRWNTDIEISHWIDNMIDEHNEINSEITFNTTY
jgi:hypothetical protein